MLSARSIAALLWMGLVARCVAAPTLGWEEIASNVWRSRSLPAVYVVHDAEQAIVVGAARNVAIAEFAKEVGFKIEAVLLTHHHRDSTASAEAWAREGIKVRAPQASLPWLTPVGVAGYWQDNLPRVTPGVFPPLFTRQWGKWQYWVHGSGLERVRCDISEGDVIDCGGWKLRAVATPGHSPDHMTFLATHTTRKERIAFCGDAFFRPGKFWTPYTTDWHHQNSDGLVAAMNSLRSVAAQQPTLLCPEHGEVVREGVEMALVTTAEALKRVADAKSYSDFAEARGFNDSVSFLAPDQVGTATPDGNTRPWTKLSPHLLLSGNTYALLSRDGHALLMDPYSRGLPGRIEELQRDFHVSNIDAMLISHAHNDHYTGVYAFEKSRRPPVWTLDKIADVVTDPTSVRAPYVDPRPLMVDRRLKDGEVIAWREYRLHVWHQPGQTRFAMSVETEVDGKRVIFTGDNFYRVDQYSGSGGWSGHNRGLPHGYLQSIQRVLKLKPDWILAEHGGAFTFDAADFEHRKAWAEEAIAAADAISPSGDHRIDWNAHRFQFEPSVLRIPIAKTATVMVKVVDERQRETFPRHISSFQDATAQQGSAKVSIRFAPSPILALSLESRIVEMKNGAVEVQLALKNGVQPGIYALPATVVAVGEDRENDVVVVVILDR